MPKPPYAIHGPLAASEIWRFYSLLEDFNSFFFLVLSFELLLPNMCKEERKQRQRSTYRSFTWSETPMENIVGIGLSTLKVIVLFPIGSSRNVFLESYILKLLLILCIYININDVFFFQILHMTSQNKKHFTKSRKLTLALIMRPLMVTKKMAIANDSPSKWQKNQQLLRPHPLVPAQNWEDSALKTLKFENCKNIKKLLEKQQNDQWIRTPKYIPSTEKTSGTGWSQQNQELY